MSERLTERPQLKSDLGKPATAFPTGTAPADPTDRIQVEGVVGDLYLSRSSSMCFHDSAVDLRVFNTERVSQDLRLSLKQFRALMKCAALVELRLAQFEREMGGGA